jgi:hypothetical protein
MLQPTGGNRGEREERGAGAGRGEGKERKRNGKQGSWEGGGDAGSVENKIRRGRGEQYSVGTMFIRMSIQLDQNQGGPGCSHVLCVLHLGWPLSEGSGFNCTSDHAQTNFNSI